MVYIQYDNNWMRNGRHIVVYICRRTIKNGEIVYVVKDKPCNDPRARTVNGSMEEYHLEEVPEGVLIQPDGTVAITEW